MSVAEVIGGEQGSAEPVLPDRAGPPPKLGGPRPHQQLTQNAPPAMRRQVLNRGTEPPDVIVGPSPVSVPGAVAFYPRPAKATGPRAAFQAATEFAHVHPRHDGSPHLTLPARLTGPAEEAGWVRRHPVAGTPPLFGPRDEAESDIIWHLAPASYRSTGGRTVHSRR